MVWEGLPIYGPLGLWVAYMVYNETINRKEMREAIMNNTKVIQELKELIRFYGSRD